MFTSKPNGVAFQMDHEHPSAPTYCQMILTRLKPKNSRPSKSLMQRPDTSVNPKVAAMRLNINWDFAEEFEEADEIDDPEVPAAVVSG
uniref:Uncharacterized protein n=1 Tax=Solanum lycopersicum TaxID=4081 RepID=A0A3Q7F815_SOLLC